MTLSRCCLFLPVLVVAIHSARSASADDHFMAASVKLSTNQTPVLGITGAPPIPSGPIATLSLPHSTLEGLLCDAYGVHPWSMAGPSWIDSKYYDVIARVPTGARGQKVAEMLQKLLVERFDMRVRWETKLVNGWALVPGPLPLKLKRTDLSGDPTDLEPDGVPNRRVSVRRKDRVKTVIMKGTSMQGLANAARGEVGDPVQDLTGLKGAFDVTLEGEMDNPEDLMSNMSPASVKKSLRSYGLDLVRQKVQIKILRVDSANKTPKPN